MLYIFSPWLGRLPLFKNSPKVSWLGVIQIYTFYFLTLLELNMQNCCWNLKVAHFILFKRITFFSSCFSCRNITRVMDFMVNHGWSTSSLPRIARGDTTMLGKYMCSYASEQRINTKKYYYRRHNIAMLSSCKHHHNNYHYYLILHQYLSNINLLNIINISVISTFSTSSISL